VELPGHGARMKEPRCTSMAALVQQLQAELLPEVRWAAVH
jgi:surfactin synthase thioesterase subunit